MGGADSNKENRETSQRAKKKDFPLREVGNNSLSGKSQKEETSSSAGTSQGSLGLQLIFLQTEKCRTITQHLFVWESKSAFSVYSESYESKSVLTSFNNVCL